jgi:hypothetical protein
MLTKVNSIKKHSKKIYIKKHDKIANFNVWIVDGEYIRKNICEDFVNIGQHHHFKFIPKNEFWISKEIIPGEELYYITHLLIENRLMGKGISYEKAYRSAARAERLERIKSVRIKKLEKLKSKREKLAHKIHKNLLKKYSSGVFVWLVKGELVRDLLYIDFAGGGHHKVYPFIPREEVWIDDDIPKDEREFIILHELHERNLMIKKKMKYLEAHRSATEIEDYCRHHPKKLMSYIKKEIKKID